MLNHLSLFIALLLAAVVLAPSGRVPALPTQRAPVYGYKVINVYPHDPTAYTQGLVFHDGFLLESTGLHGQSSLRQVELTTGRVLKKIDVPREYFAEGISILGRSVFQLTWTSGKCFIYDLDTFKKAAEAGYEGEGWGLATDGRSLIMSDGTDRIRFIDPNGFKNVRTIAVRDGDAPVRNLNELDFVKGEVLANVWQTDRIARIDPSSGRVLGWIDLAGILPERERGFDPENVLNGIAYDRRRNRLFITGKRWPKLFEIRITAKRLL
jgi:glutamine cyclotransferase